MQPNICIRMSICCLILLSGTSSGCRYKPREDFREHEIVHGPLDKNWKTYVRYAIDDWASKHKPEEEVSGEGHEDIFPGISNSDLGITPEIEAEIRNDFKRKEIVCKEMLGSKRFDDYWFNVAEFDLDDDVCQVKDIAVLHLYFNKRGVVSVILLQDPEYAVWNVVHTGIDFFVDRNITSKPQ